jgi:hypothetical protein
MIALGIRFFGTRAELDAAQAPLKWNPMRPMFRLNGTSAEPSPA